jgi:hypothetical protein
MKDLLNPGYKKKDCVDVTSSNLENLQSENFWLASQEITPSPPAGKLLFQRVGTKSLVQYKTTRTYLKCISTTITYSSQG